MIGSGEELSEDSESEVMSVLGGLDSLLGRRATVDFDSDLVVVLAVAVTTVAIQQRRVEIGNIF